RALGHAHSYSSWRRRRQGSVPEVAGLDSSAARAFVHERLASGGTHELDPTAEDARTLLAYYGIDLMSMVPAPTLDDAIRAMTAFGGEVVLKATARHL